MPFSLDEVVPWGRTFDEYSAMFALDGDDLGKRIVGCADGPAAFNAALSRLGGSVVSVDPLYRFTAEEIESRIDDTFDLVMEQTRRNAVEFTWTRIRSAKELGQLRMGAMSEFLADYPQGMIENRYVFGELPDLPFPDGAFDIALCSHFLFLYSRLFDLGFHIKSIRELCRIAGEARIFPLMELGSRRSRHLNAVIKVLSAEGYRVAIDRVEYEFQKGGNEMLRVSLPGCGSSSS
jgi:hypothetical protein